MRRHILIQAILLALGGTLLTGCGGGDGSSTSTIPDETNQMVSALGTLSGTVIDTRTGSPIEGANISLGNQTTSTNQDGRFTIENIAVADRILVEVSKEGYEPAYVVSRIVANQTGNITAKLLPFEVTSSILAENGGTVSDPASGASVMFPPGVLNASGYVNVSLANVMPGLDPFNMPGDFTTVDSNGNIRHIESFGAIAASIKDSSGNDIDLATGQTATIRIPVSSRNANPPESIPLYYFDEQTARWIEEGRAFLDASRSYYEGNVSHFTYWNADYLYESINVTGCVADQSGNRLSGFEILSEGIDYTGISTSYTDQNGNFIIPVKSNANLTLIGRKYPQLTNTIDVSSSNQDITLDHCLIVGESIRSNGFSVKLTWGAQPHDLDSWIITPTGESIYFVNQGSLFSEPYVNLDVDDTDSYGPEVITVIRPRVGTYRYYVNNYSEYPIPGISTSPARVELTSGDGTRVFVPPAGETDKSLNWIVFDITVNADCSTSVSTVNEWSDDPTPLAPTTPPDPNAPFCGN